MPKKKEDIEPFEWYKAFRNGEQFDEGPTPVPEGVRDHATEIQWSNPTKDPNAEPDSPPENSSIPPWTPPAEASNVENAPRFDPSAWEQEHAKPEE